MKHQMIVGLTGKAGSGKDTAAAALVDSGWVRLAFADALKHLARIIGWNGAKDDAGRALLQNLGTGVRVVIGNDTWLDIVARMAAGTDKHVVVTDVRFPNEAEWVKTHYRHPVLPTFSEIWRIERPDAGLTGAAGDHPSETALDQWPHDRVVLNVDSIEALHYRMRVAASVMAGRAVSHHETVPLTQESVTVYLDRAIRRWRDELAQHNEVAPHYIDAFQSVRANLIGSTLPPDTR